jgi:hypothetical protein
MQLGRAITADGLLAHANGDRRLVMDTLGLAIAQLVPASYRGVYGNEHEFLDAMRVLQDSQRTA